MNRNREVIEVMVAAMDHVISVGRERMETVECNDLGQDQSIAGLRPDVSVTGVYASRSQGCYYAEEDLQIECSNQYCIGCEEFVGCDCACLYDDYFCTCTARGFACEGPQ